jgi:multiple sugar transport system substrate-binding protein
MSGKKLSRRSFLALVAAASSSAVLTACGATPTATPVPPTPTKPPTPTNTPLPPAATATKPPAVATAAPTVAAKAIGPSKPTKIIFYQRGYTAGGTDSTTVGTDKAIAQFQKDNPNITVEIVGIPWTAEGDTKLETALAAKTDINIFRVTSVNLPRYAKQGFLSEVTPYLTDADRADFYPSAFDAASYKGKVYAWPLWVTAEVILANTDIFKEKGIALPDFDKGWTYEQFVDVAQKLTFTRADGTKVYGVSASFVASAIEAAPMFYIDGGRILSKDGKTFTANKPEFVSALQKYADLGLKYKCVPPDFASADQTTVQGYFQKTKSIAMHISTPGFIRTLASANFPLAILPIPMGALGKPVTTGGFGLYAVVDHPDKDKTLSAHLLANYLTGSKVGQDVPGYQLAPGLRRSNHNLDNDPYFKYVAKSVEFGVYEVPTEVPNEIQNTAWTAALQSVLLGQKKAQDAMNEIGVQYQKALDEANK